MKKRYIQKVDINMNTQIFATFGPACKEEYILQKMIEAGMTGMRLNLSHTTLEESKPYIEAYHNAAASLKVKPQILIDMQGPELRIGDLKHSLQLEEGQKVLIGEDGIPVPQVVIEALTVGAKILLDDGKILIKVTEMSEAEVQASVLRGGLLQGHKSIKIQNANVMMPVLTEHDIENIKVAKKYGVTALMQPFVRSGKDLCYVRDVLKEYHAQDIQIYAKIENRIGIENLENILPESDVCVIARGDLGNDMPLWELPKIQKEIEHICKKHHKPYIVVTQMLASMEERPLPTRAEVSDIFHAVYHGAWGVMITGETAVGHYPVEAVKYLTNTAKEAEKYQ